MLSALLFMPLHGQGQSRQQAQKQPYMLKVTIATMEGVTGSSIPVHESSLPSIGVGVATTPTVSIDPMYARTEAALANAAFEDIPRENHRERAQGLFTLLRLTEYESVAKQFDTTVMKVSALQLAKQWKKTADLLGEFRRINNISAEQFATGELITVEADFERVLLDVKFSFTEQHLLNGLAFAPAGPKYKLPPYYAPGNVEERTVTVQSGYYQLPGILTLPRNIPPDGRVPVAILLHGAGAEDKDRTSGPLKPAKDLALGLATEGIASLRYEKRTKLYALKGKEAEQFTVMQEVIEDAVSALDLVRSLSENTPLDTKNIVIIAPNLAATLIPRIAEHDKKRFFLVGEGISGAVLIAANASPWHQTLIQRFRKAFLLDGSINADERRVLNTLDKEITLVNSDTLSTKTPADKLPFNLPGSYWLDLRAYNHVRALKNTRLPLFFIHGEQDRYIDIEEFTSWQKHFGEKANVQFKSYPKVVNLLVPEPPANETSEKPANIPLEIIRDIADWIKKH